MAHIVSNTKPPTGEYGDEWFNPIENVTYKLLPASGSNGSWHAFGNVGSTILSTANNVTNIYITSTTTVTNTTTATTVLSGIPGDIYWNWNSLLIDAPQSNAIVNFDASTNRIDIKPVGGVNPTNYTPYQGDGYYSNYFDGTGDYLQMPDNTAYDYTGDFTMEAWIYPTALVNDTSFLSQWTSGGWCFIFRVSSNLLTFVYWTGSGSTLTGSSGICTIPLNKWTHVAVSRSGSIIRLFVNGVVDTNTATYGSTISGSALMEVGGVDGASNNWSGYISNVRIVKGTALYTATFTPPTSPLTTVAGTSLLTCQSNRLIDNSVVNATITKYGDTTISSAIPFTPNSSYSTYGSAYFDGTSGYLTMTNNPVALGSGSFTMEMWLNPTATPTGAVGNNGWIYGYRSGDDTSPYMQIAGSGRAVYFGGDVTNFLISTIGIPLNAWTHVAVVRNGTAAAMYFNGNSVATATVTNNFTYTGPNAIGQEYPRSGGHSYYWPGYISDFRIVAGTAVYTANFTPPSSPLPVISNTGLLTLQYNGSYDTRNAAIIDEGNFKAQLTRPIGSNVTVGTFSPRTPNTFGNIYIANVNGGSAYFDGSGDYIQDISNRSNAAYTLSGDFTAEAWIYPKSLSGTYTVFCLGSEGVNRFVAYIVNGQLTTNKYGNTSVYYTGANVAGNAWNHIAISRTASTVRGFANGIVSSTTSTPYGTIGNGGFKLGADSGAANQFYGYISGFRLAKKGLYTTSFTPNTAAVAISTGLNPNNVSSVYFNGTSFLDSPSTTQFVFGNTTNFSIEAWVYPLGYNQSGSGPPDKGTIWSCGVAEVGVARPVFGINSSGKLVFGGWNTAYSPGSNTIPLNQWSHVAITFDGTTYRLFYNGAVDGTSTSIINFNITPVTATIGGNPDGTYRYPFLGYISNLRVVKGSAVYTSAFTPSTTPLTTTSQGVTPSQVVMLTCQSSTIIDVSPNSFALTTSGTPTTSTTSPFSILDATDTNLLLNFTSGGIIDYTGKGNFETANVGLNANITPKFNRAIGPFRKSDTFITVPHDTKYDLLLNDTNPFTIDYWIYPTDIAGLGGNGGIIIQKDGVSSTKFPQWRSTLLQDGNIQFVIGDATGASINQFPTGNIVLAGNTWNHIAHTRSIANVLTTYVNGNVASMTFQNITPAGTSGPLTIGSQPGSTNEGFYGYLENIRITKGVNRYNAPFVPTAANINAGNATIITSYGYTTNSSVTTVTTSAPSPAPTGLSTGTYANGEILFTSSGNWTAPAYVTSISMVGVGGGQGGGYATFGGGGGGGLAWVNSYPVVAGRTYTIVVGAGGTGAPPATPSSGLAGGNTYFQSNINGVLSNVIVAYGGSNTYGGSYFANSSFGPSGGGRGGNSFVSPNTLEAAGGGGAGGYTGPGGNGGFPSPPGSYPSTPGPGASGLGGGGGGGGSTNESPSQTSGAGGGGVGIWGQGDPGAGGPASHPNAQATALGFPAPATTGGGAGGSGGGWGNIAVSGPGWTSGTGGLYGGGGGARIVNSGNEIASPGAQGAVRLIWGTMPRLFPNTFTSNAYIT
jgi:hypothetical protein